MLRLSLTIVFSIVCFSNQSMVWPEESSPAITEVIHNGSAFGSYSYKSKRATTCILPAYPDHGTFGVLNMNKAQPGQSYSTLVLSVSCQRGYAMESSDGGYGNSSLVVCDQGVWYQTIPKCVRLCKLDPDPSVEYRCHIPDVGFRTCEGYLAPGTLVSPVCRSPEYSSHTDIVLDMECIRGQWNYIAKCKADCGRVVPKGGLGLISGGTYSAQGEVPWHVGLYRKTTTPYEQICGGTIITTKVVISAAHCFPTRSPSEYGVAAGKIYRPWDEKIDVHAQKSDVKEIKIPRLYQGATGHFGVDISVVVLVSSLILNSYVRPVCLSFDPNFDQWQLQHGQLGKVAGWGLTSANGAESPILQVVDFPFISVDSCLNSVPQHFRPYITGDKFCAGYTNGTALCKGDSGGGLAFPDKEWDRDRYYLRGIVSTAPRNDGNDICNELTYTAFTRVAAHQDFIKKPPKPDFEPCEWMELKGKCVPARKCLTTLSIDEQPPACPDKDGQPNYICCTDCQLVNDTSNFIIGPNDKLGNVVFWKDGRKARDACLQYTRDWPNKCAQSGVTGGVKRVLHPGSQCHNYDTTHISNAGWSGRWESVLISAYAYLAVLGRGDTLETANWHTHGTIISEKFVLSAAHVREGDKPVKFTAMNWRDYESYFYGYKQKGVYRKDWQTHRVKKIHVHPGYKADLGTFTKYNDIALYELETSITFNEMVMPVCLPDPAEDFDGTSVMFFGRDKKDSTIVLDESHILDYKEISEAQCNAEIAKFSAESDLPLPKQAITSESEMCFGSNDSCNTTYEFGDPLLAPSQYTNCMKDVIGIASWNFSCKSIVFTRVKYYTRWIESIVWPST